MLYAAHKFYDPVVAGHHDYFDYYKMHEHPLDFSAAISPFVYRQFSALATHAIYAAGIYYPNEIAFNDPQVDPRLFFAALTANYLALVLAATLAGAVTERQTEGFVFPLLAGLLCLLSFFSQSIAVTGLTEGMTWLFFAALYFLYVLQHRVGFALLLALSIFQREMIPVAFGLLAAFSWLLRDGDRRYNFLVLALSVLCFAAYAAIRLYIIAAPGFETQLSLSFLVGNLISPSMTLREIVVQGLVAQNLIIISLGVAAAQWLRGGTVPKHLLVLMLTFAGVVTIVIAEDIDGGTGRISSMLSPAFAAFAATSLYRYERSRTRTQAPEPM